MKSDLRSKSVLLPASATLRGRLQEQELCPGAQAVLTPFGRQSEQGAGKTLKKMPWLVFVPVEAVPAVGSALPGRLPLQQ